MLVVFNGNPTAAPEKALFGKGFIRQIVFIDFVRERLCPVRIIGGYFGENNRFRFRPFDIRIVKRIDVYGQSERMIGKLV